MNLYSPSFQQFPTPGHGSVGAACAAFAQVWSCAICLGGAEAGASVRQLPCGHCFHGDCIKAGLPVGQGVWGAFRGRKMSRKSRCEERAYRDLQW